MTFNEEVESSTTTTLEDCYRFIDVRRDAGDEKAAQTVSFACGAAEHAQRHLKMLAWACVEKSAAKRRATFNQVRMEIEANGGSAAHLPMKQEQPKK